jgi:hypothetical protein
MQSACVPHDRRDFLVLVIRRFSLDNVFVVEDTRLIGHGAVHARHLHIVQPGFATKLPEQLT